MDNINYWLSKIKKEFDIVYNQNRNKHEIIEETLLLNSIERQEIIKEIGNSPYSLDKINTFLGSCKNKHRFMYKYVTIHVLCNKIGKRLHTQIINTLYRTNTILKIFLGNNMKKIVITLVPIDEPRKKPKGTDIVQPYHINGGYTYIHDETIFIYRLEEWPKVALHELLHKIPMLQNTKWTPSILRKMYQTFKINMEGCPYQCSTNLEPTESIIEAWAIFLHTAFMSFEKNRDFSRLLKDEIKWNNQQIQWILQKQKTMEDGKWKEDTHAFSYLILRGILLHNLNIFLGMTIPYNPNELYKLWEKEWTKMVKKTNNNKNENSLRMSKYGDV